MSLSSSLADIIWRAHTCSTLAQLWPKPIHTLILILTIVATLLLYQYYRSSCLSRLYVIMVLITFVMIASIIRSLSLLMQDPKQLPLCRLMRRMHNSVVRQTEDPGTSSAAASGGVIAYMRRAAAELLFQPHC